CELGFVRELLKVTTTTATEVRTGRLNPQRRRRKDLFNYRKQHIPLLALNSHAHTISGRRKRNKHRLPLRMGQSHANPKTSFNLNREPRKAQKAQKRKKGEKSRIAFLL